MNRGTVARCFGIVALTYGLDPSAAIIDVWAGLLVDVDDTAGVEATRRLCRRDSPFPPRPGEILALAKRLTGQQPPPVDAAVGHYLAGDWDIHPDVRFAAERVHWDRAVKPDQAAAQFKALYATRLYAHSIEADLPAVGSGGPVDELGP